MGLAHSPRIVTDGLVLALDAGNTKSYPGSGTTWTDTVGGNNATLTGPTYNSDNGGALIFDGFNDYATISNASALGGFSGDFTIEFWFKGGNQTGYAVFLETHTTSTQRWAIQAEASGTANMIWVRSGSVIFTTSGIDALDDAWHHHAVVRNGSAINYYIDGVSRGSESYSAALSACTDLIIGEYSNGSYHIDGRMSAIRIYNGKGLTAAEVQQNYNALKARYLSYPTPIVTSGLILHLDAASTESYSGSGNTWIDVSGQGNDATRTSSSEVVYNSSGWFDWTDGPAYDSTQGCFTLPGNSFTLGANFTIEVWNYYDASSTPNSGSSVSPWTDGCLWTNSADADWSDGAGNNNGLLFGYNSFTYRNTSGTQINVDYSTNPSTQTWHQHVLVVNSGTATVYVDKVSVATGSNFRTIGQSNGTLGIGIADKYVSDYRGEYNGFISNVKIYSKALSTSEIEQNYDALIGRYA